MATEKEQMQADLERQLIVRSEFDEHKADAIAQVQLHLYSVAGVCASEAKAIKRDGEIADGNIDAAVEQLHAAIERFRSVQQGIKALNNAIEDMVRDVADDEFWK